MINIPNPTAVVTAPVAISTLPSPSRVKLTPYPPRAHSTTVLLPVREICFPHHGEDGRNSIEPSISRAAHTDRLRFVCMTRTGSTTSRPFCPIPRRPALNASGQQDRVFWGVSSILDDIVMFQHHVLIVFICKINFSDNNISH
uniref:ShiG n=1 Tax=Escherichia coli TaxID=562 RepID=Q5DQI2_ECOLX|nr:ShiG [Escherichia coli]